MNRERVARYLHLAALACLALVLFTFGTGRIELGLFSFGGKAFKILPYLLLFGWGAAWLRRGRIEWQGALVRAGGLFLVAGVIATAGSQFPYSDSKVLGNLLGGFTFYLFLRHVEVTPRQARFLWLAFLAGHVYLCGVALAQDMAGRARLTGTFEHFNMLAGYLMLVLPALAWLAHRNTGWKRVALIALSVLSLYLLGHTYSRAALFGTAAGALALIVLGAGAPRKAGIVFVLLIAALVAWDAPAWKGRIGEIGAELSAPEPLSRMTLWTATLERIAARPECLVLGRGWGDSFSHELAQSHAGFLHPMLYERYTHAHNLYLQLLFAYGLFGLGAFLWMIRDWMAAVGRSGPAVWFLAGGITFLVHENFDVLLAAYNLPLVFFTLLALGERACKTHPFAPNRGDEPG